MKSLYESIFDVDDNIENMDIRVIQKFLEDNLMYDTYKHCIISKKKNKDGKYEVSATGDVTFRPEIEYLTNEMFIWTAIAGDFWCAECRKLKSMEGGPKKVTGSMSLYCCTSLESLKYAPKTVGGIFDCSYCRLNDLKGAPKMIGRDFYFDTSGGKIKASDVRKVSKVNGNIYV